MLSRLLPPVRLEREKAAKLPATTAAGPRFGRKRTVNRPFCAFAILLTLLVLATIGVSSSSRSTQVRVIPKKAIEKQTRRCGSGTFVFALPEVASPAVSCSIASVQIELADGSGSFECQLDAVDCRS